MSDDALVRARIALRRGAPEGQYIPACSCFAPGSGKPICTSGICEDAAKHVAIALREIGEQRAATERASIVAHMLRRSQDGWATIQEIAGEIERGDHARPEPAQEGGNK